MVDSELGLKSMLRKCYFHSTEPAEFDYFSPETPQFARNCGNS